MQLLTRVSSCQNNLQQYGEQNERKQRSARSRKQRRARSRRDTLQGNATVYCIRLGNEAQNSTVFGTIATSSDKILDANTEGDLITGFNAITSSESDREDTVNSSKGIITIVADLDTTKSITVTKPDGTSGTYNSISELNASGFITYNTENKTFTWNVLNYANDVTLSISYSVN